MLAFSPSFGVNGVTGEVGVFMFLPPQLLHVEVPEGSWLIPILSDEVFHSGLFALGESGRMDIDKRDGFFFLVELSNNCSQSNPHSMDVSVRLPRPHR